MRSFKKLEYLKYLNNNDDGINDSFYEKEFSNSSIFLRLGGRHSVRHCCDSSDYEVEIIKYEERKKEREKEGQREWKKLIFA